MHITECPYKVGDRVECIDFHEFPHGWPILLPEKIYTVQNIILSESGSGKICGVNLVEHQDLDNWGDKPAYTPERFILYKPVIKIILT